MTACGTYTSHQSGYCMNSAAACASMRIINIMDTVAALAVSIFVRLISLRLWTWNA